MILTLQIPVQPHVLKFLESKHKDGFKLSRKHNEGKMLIHMLRNPQGDKSFDDFLAKCTANLTVKISQSLFKDKGCSHITARTIFDFNDFVDANIKDEFLLYVNTLKTAGINFTLDQMIDGFMGRYFFDEGDIKPETLKQHYYRTDKKINGPKWFKKKNNQKNTGFSAVVVTFPNSASAVA